MYNNDVTYADKWKTPENEVALKKLESKFFDRSVCSPSCPVAWAPEVLEMLEKIDEAFGIKRNTSTMRGYYIQGTSFRHFFIDPFKAFKDSFYSSFIKKVDPSKKWEIESRNKPVFERLKRVVSATIRPIKYGIRALKITKINPLLNKYYKPQISLDQVKEKYGSLCLYYSGPEYTESFVDSLLRETEVKLAIKGAYYPIESLYKYSRSLPGKEDIFESHGYKYISTHRTAMDKLGLNLDDIKLKCLESETKKEG